jgi:hypothetical protein
MNWLLVNQEKRASERRVVGIAKGLRSNTHSGSSKLERLDRSDVPNAICHFRSLERLPDFAPVAFLFVFSRCFVLRRSSFDSRTASASFAFARGLISRSSPVSAMVASSLLIISLSRHNVTAKCQPWSSLVSRHSTVHQRSYGPRLRNNHSFRCL